MLLTQNVSAGRIKRIAISAEPLSAEAKALEEAAALEESTGPDGLADESRKTSLKEVNRWPKSLE